jgi:Zinc-ribbon/Ring finger domain
MDDSCCRRTAASHSNHSDLRKLIQGVRKNESLTLKEKTQAIQSIMTGSYRSAICVESSHQSKAASHASATTVLPNNTANFCRHYVKNCSQFKFSCCGTVDPCHRCHLERGCDISPPQVESVKCNSCDTEQPPSRVCINKTCKAVFSANHCSECLVWTQSDIHHCHGCGLCRVGNSESLFHCTKCEACFHISTRETHICTVLSMKHQRCPLCLEATHSSQKRCVILRCGHVGHYECLQQAWSHDRGMVPKCPTCRKSLLPAESMRVYWDAIRSSIELQPITSELIAINVGDEVSSPYGQFLVDRIISAPIKNSLDGAVTDVNLYHGRLIGWKLNSGTVPTATLHLRSLKKDLMTTISCNDCEKRSTANFHFLGMECKHCKGYNTARV